MKKIKDKTKQMIQVETKLGEEVEEVLRHLYVDKNLEVFDVAKILGISHVTTLKWLELAGIYSRKLRVGS